MFSEDQLLPLSALQHLLFCERQCALIHVEQLWAENRLTVEGALLHRRAHDGADDWKGPVRIVRGLPLRSLLLGLIGQSDVVEFEKRSGDSSHTRVAERVPVPQFASQIRSEPHAWRVTPVEYKRGRPKKDHSDRVQLCAQALCLEEMLGVQIPKGQLFYGTQRRRTEVSFDAALRDLTMDTAAKLQRLFASGVTPPAQREPKCDNCSLFEKCLPHAVERGARVAAFIDRQFAAAGETQGPAGDLFEEREATA